jgi:hypothetical protein
MKDKTPTTKPKSSSKSPSKSGSKPKTTSSVSKQTPQRDFLKNPTHPFLFEHLRNAYLTALSHEDMPKFDSKKRKSAVDDDSDGTPATKRGKGVSGASFQPSVKSQKDAEGNTFWEISKARRVTVSEYKGKIMVAIREYYEKDDEMLPGKKASCHATCQFSGDLILTSSVRALQ